MVFILRKGFGYDSLYHTLDKWMKNRAFTPLEKASYPVGG